MANDTDDNPHARLLVRMLGPARAGLVVGWLLREEVELEALYVQRHQGTQRAEQREVALRLAGLGVLRDKLNDAIAAESGGEVAPDLADAHDQEDDGDGN